MELTKVPRVFSMMGINLDVKVNKLDSSGSASVIEQTVSPSAGSPPHICHNADKMIYVVEGSFTLRSGKEDVKAGPGNIIFIPKGAVHNYKNTGDTNGKLLITLTPGGHEEFLYELSLAAKESKPSTEIMNEIGSRHAVEMV